MTLHYNGSLLQKLTAALIAYGPWGVFLLGLLDSAGVPLPGSMDVLLVVVAAAAPPRAWFAASLAIAGSLAGNITLYLLARRGGRRFAEHAPQPGKPRRFREWYSRYGLLTVFVPAVVPVIPLPLKVFVISAGVLRTPLRSFVAVILLARVIRYGALAWLGMRMGSEGARTFLAHHAWTLAGVAAALALASFTLIRLADRYRTRVKPAKRA